MKPTDVPIPLLLAPILTSLGLIPATGPPSGSAAGPAVGASAASGPARTRPNQTAPVAGVVRTEGRPAADVVVYLETEDAVDDEVPAPVASIPIIDQSHLEFIPGVLAVRRGMTVDFLNSDGILHNVFSPGWSGEEFDLGTYPSGTARDHTFTRTGPHVILCKVHPEMVAYVVVVETPWFAVSDSDGRFSIPGVPPGRYRLTVWHRGQEERHVDVVVPSGGLDALTVDLSDPDGLVAHDGP